MANKRQNPFGDLNNQLKKHIGEKEVNLGVMKEEKMKHVYDKTLKLLFKGASHQLNGEEDVEKANGFFTNNAVSPKKCCQSCSAKSKCSFCEICICDDCSCHCSACGGIFCNLCSILKYTEMEQAICLSCQRH